MRKPTDLTKAFQWWRDAVEGNFGPVHDGHPQCGYYRMRKGKEDGSWVPVEFALEQPIDKETGELTGDERMRCYVGTAKDRRERDANEVWTWCSKHPVTFEEFTQAHDTGSWPDDPPKPKEPGFLESLTPGIGHNQPDDPVEALRVELLGETEIAEKFLAEEIKTHTQANKIGPWAKRLISIKNRANDARKFEKQPHTDAGRAVDAKWNPIIDEAAALVIKLKKHVEPFLLAEQQKEKARAAQAAEEAEKLRQQSEQAAQMGGEMGQAAAVELSRQAAAKEEAARPRNASAGRTGAKVHLRTEKRAKVVDYKAAACAMLDMEHDELKEKIDQLVQRAVKAGVKLAGVEVEEVSKAA